MFPSPYGDMVLKFRTEPRKGMHQAVSVPLRGYGFEIARTFKCSVKKEVKFPSPYGDMVLKFLKRVGSEREGRKFPSPYGDMVLKSCKRG